MDLAAFPVPPRLPEEATAAHRPTSQQQQKYRQVQGSIEALEGVLKVLDELQGPLRQHLLTDQDSRHAQERLGGIVGLCKKQLAANRVYAARSLQPTSPQQQLSSGPHTQRLSCSSGAGDDLSPFPPSSPHPHHSPSCPPRRGMKRLSTSLKGGGRRMSGTNATGGFPPVPPPSYGVCLSSGLYFMLESLLIRTEAERLTLFVQNAAGELCAAVRVGAGVTPVTKEVPISNTSLLQVVRATGMAANLASVDLADVAECPGPSVAKNTLIFPLSNFIRPHRIEGCIQLVNKRRGLEAFGAQDEIVVQQIRPSIACFLHRYPLPVPLQPFDPIPLHNWSPLPQYTLPTIGLDATLTATPKQLVFHRYPGDRFTAKFWMNSVSSANGGSSTAGDDVLSDGGGGGEGGKMVRIAGDGLSAAASLLDAEAYMKTMDDCWRSSVAESMLLERMVQQKQSHINDAREIISRKQKKLELLKSTLVDEVDRHLRGTSALTAVGAGTLHSPRSIGVHIPPGPSSSSRVQRRKRKERGAGGGGHSEDTY